MTEIFVHAYRREVGDDIRILDDDKVPEVPSIGDAGRYFFNTLMNDTFVQKFKTNLILDGSPEKQTVLNGLLDSFQAAEKASKNILETVIKAVDSGEALVQAGKAFTDSDDIQRQIVWNGREETMSLKKLLIRKLQIVSYTTTRCYTLSLWKFREGLFRPCDDDGKVGKKIEARLEFIMEISMTSELRRKAQENLTKYQVEVLGLSAEDKSKLRRCCGEEAVLPDAEELESSKDQDEDSSDDEIVEEESEFQPDGSLNLNCDDIVLLPSDGGPVQNVGGGPHSANIPTLTPILVPKRPKGENRTEPTGYWSSGFSRRLKKKVSAKERKDQSNRDKDEASQRPALPAAKKKSRKKKGKTGQPPAAKKESRMEEEKDSKGSAGLAVPPEDPDAEGGSPEALGLQLDSKLSAQISDWSLTPDTFSEIQDGYNSRLVKLRRVCDKVASQGQGSFRVNYEVVIPSILQSRGLTLKDLDSWGLTSDFVLNILGGGIDFFDSYVKSATTFDARFLSFYHQALHLVNSVVRLPLIRVLDKVTRKQLLGNFILGRKNDSTYLRAKSIESALLLIIQRTVVMFNSKEDALILSRGRGFAPEALQNLECFYTAYQVQTAELQLGQHSWTNFLELWECRESKIQLRIRDVLRSHLPTQYMIGKRVSGKTDEQVTQMRGCYDPFHRFLNTLRKTVLSCDSSTTRSRVYYGFLESIKFCDEAKSNTDMFMEVPSLNKFLEDPNKSGPMTYTADREFYNYTRDNFDLIVYYFDLLKQLEMEWNTWIHVALVCKSKMWTDDTIPKELKNSILDVINGPKVEYGDDVEEHCSQVRIEDVYSWMAGFGKSAAEDIVDFTHARNAITRALPQCEDLSQASYEGGLVTVLRTCRDVVDSLCLTLPEKTIEKRNPDGHSHTKSVVSVPVPAAIMKRPKQAGIANLVDFIKIIESKLQSESRYVINMAQSQDVSDALLPISVGFLQRQNNVLLKYNKDISIDLPQSELIANPDNEVKIHGQIPIDILGFSNACCISNMADMQILNILINEFNRDEELVNWILEDNSDSKSVIQTPKEVMNSFIEEKTWENPTTPSDAPLNLKYKMLTGKLLARFCVDFPYLIKGNGSNNGVLTNELLKPLGSHTDSYVKFIEDARKHQQECSSLEAYTKRLEDQRELAQRERDQEQERCERMENEVDEEVFERLKKAGFETLANQMKLELESRESRKADAKISKGSDKDMKIEAKLAEAIRRKEIQEALAKRRAAEAKSSS